MAPKEIKMNPEIEIREELYKLNAKLDALSAEIKNTNNTNKSEMKHFKELYQEKLNNSIEKTESLEKEIADLNARVVEAHQRKDQIDEKLNKLNQKIAYFSGGLAAVFGLITILMEIFGR